MKLVRDRIPEIIMKKGGIVEIRTANSAEYELMLIKKLQEEVDEFIDGRSLEEIADIEEVLMCYSEHKGVNWDKIEVIRKNKNEEKGSFKKRIILEKVN